MTRALAVKAYHRTVCAPCVPLWGTSFQLHCVCSQIASTGALLMFGAVGAWLGGAKRIRAAMRVLVGGWLAMAITFGTGRLFGEDPA